MTTAVSPPARGAPRRTPAPEGAPPTEASAAPSPPEKRPSPAVDAEAGGVIRRILASSTRARDYWRGKGPGVIVWMNKTSGVRVRAKEVVAHEGTLPAAWRRIKVPVNVTALSAAARAILLAAAEPDNRQRGCDYRFETGLTWERVFGPDAPSRQVWGQGFWSQPFQWTLHWPTLLDDESGEAYYERCAKLVELTRLLLARGVPPGAIAGLVGGAERLAGQLELHPLLLHLWGVWEQHQQRPQPKRYPR